MDWSRLQGWLFDLDGVVWHGDDPVPGSVELIAALRRSGRRVAFLTNNSSQSVAEVTGRLNRLGVPATADQVITPLEAAGEYLRQRYGRVRVLAFGAPALAEAIAREGHTVVIDPAQADAVVMGRDPDMTYEKLTHTCWAVDRGIPFLALNQDLRFPGQGGRWYPGLGAMTAAVTAVTGRRPEIIGKPAKPLFLSALAHLGVPASAAVMIGDTPASDIAGGLGVGMWTVLVGGAQGEPQPHWRVKDPAELLRDWQATTAGE